MALHDGLLPTSTKGRGLLPLLVSCPSSPSCSFYLKTHVSGIPQTPSCPVAFVVGTSIGDTLPLDLHVAAAIHSWSLLKYHSTGSLLWLPIYLKPQPHCLFFLLYFHSTYYTTFIVPVLFVYLLSSHKTISPIWERTWSCLSLHLQCQEQCLPWV